MTSTDENGEQSLKTAQDYLRRSNARGRIIFACLTGSQAYNLKQENSDFDFKGIFLAPTEQCFGLDQPPESLSCHPNPDPEAPDITLYEVKHFCNLVADGDPFMLELLFTDRFLHRTPLWDKLRAERKLFLSHKSVERHLGYARKQIKRYIASEKAIPGKRIYHVFRLADTAEDILDGKDVQLWVEGPRREFLQQVRNDAFTKAQIVEMADKRLSALEQRLASMPPSADTTPFLESWLLRARRQELVP